MFIECLNKSIKLSIIAICLSLCLSCASKTIAKPEEVNDYLIKITERSNFDLLNCMNRR
jgi:hypothetical protein